MLGSSDSETLVSGLWLAQPASAITKATRKKAARIFMQLEVPYYS
jgi:hypothetical protein